MTQVLITGITGFIGSRLAEVACARGLRVVGLVRTWPRAARVARMPISLHGGDLMDTKAVRAAMRGCDVVVHCAVDNRARGMAHRRASAQGTASVMRAAMDSDIKRVIHLSSAAVFSYRPTPDAATEEGAYRYSGDAYCDGKIDAEKIALRYARQYRMPVTVLRPTIVYGPFGDISVTAAHLLRIGAMRLVNGGEGVCNSLYVDNLIDAVLLAAERQMPGGEIFHVSDAHPVTWRMFVESHAAALGCGGRTLPAATPHELRSLRAHERRALLKSCMTTPLSQTVGLLRDAEIRRVLGSMPLVEPAARTARAMAQSLPVSLRYRIRQMLKGQNGCANGHTRAPAPRPLTPSEETMFTMFDRVVFRIEKAQQALGYHPAVAFDEGMRRTASWMRWARL